MTPFLTDEPQTPRELSIGELMAQRNGLAILLIFLALTIGIYIGSWAVDTNHASIDKAKQEAGR